MRYGVQYQPLSGSIDAGAVRAVGAQEVFIMKSDVTAQVLGAAAQWLISHDQPYQVTDRNGTTYELTAVIASEGGFPRP